MAAARALRRERKSLDWVGTSLMDLREFPREVRQDIGHALDQAQLGEKSLAAKPLKGFGGAGVLEVVDDFDGNTYRAVYTVKFEEVVYVLHAFQKKARKGVATPKADLTLIRERFKAAEMHDARTKEKS